MNLTGSKVVILFMAQKRWILLFSGGTTAISKRKISALIRSKSVNIIDTSLFPKSLLIEGSDTSINALASESDQWSILPEKNYKIPETKKKISN
ncbi:MAG TPA: hypothetical protein VGK59_14855 [Ohtaekwangia sp.]